MRGRVRVLPAASTGSAPQQASGRSPPPPGFTRHTVLVSFHVDAPGALVVELASALEACGAAACGGRERVACGQSARVGSGRTKLSQGRPECVELGVQLDVAESEAPARLGMFLDRAARAARRRHLACSRPERLAAHLSRLVLTPTPTFLKIMRGEVDVVSDPRVYREAVPAASARARSLLMALNPGTLDAVRDPAVAFAVVQDAFAGDDAERDAFHTDMSRVASAYGLMQVPPQAEEEEGEEEEGSRSRASRRRGDRVVYPSEEDAVSQELESVGRMIVLLKCMADALGEAGGLGDGQKLLVPLRAEVSVFCEPGSGRARGCGDTGVALAAAGFGSGASFDLGRFPRALSCVTFGNLAWDPAAHGGLLRLHHKETGRVADVVPEIGTVVLFRPDLVDTEVLPIGDRWRTSLSLAMHTVGSRLDPDEP